MIYRKLENTLHRSLVLISNQQSKLFSQGESHPGVCISYGVSMQMTLLLYDYASIVQVDLYSARCSVLFNKWSIGGIEKQIFGWVPLLIKRKGREIMHYAFGHWMLRMTWRAASIVCPKEINSQIDYGNSLRFVNCCESFFSIPSTITFPSSSWLRIAITSKYI